ncbi:uncharacterized protein LOC106659934 [Trichogramma pretiosum]|uniref:uncharacterized protein LOC106659934 n=1 Tax=Trichogramma pretiosum TaxID=7493 RepID=UPI0006C96C1C|nr:uncharacterized protein LOC106659934 [Trichogramma pretiosum]
MTTTTITLARVPLAIATATVLLLLNLSTPLSAEWIDCISPSDATWIVQSDDVGRDQQQLAVRDADVKIAYERDQLAVYEYVGHDLVNVLLNDTLVYFQGSIVNTADDSQDMSSKAKTTKMFKSNLAGTARLSQSGPNLTDCKWYFSRNPKNADQNVPENVEVSILREAASCAKAKLCKRIGSINFQDTVRAIKHPFQFGSISVLTKMVNKTIDDKALRQEVKTLLRQLNPEDLNSRDMTSNLQMTINRLVDLAVLEIVKKLRKENMEQINIPDLQQNFTTGSSWWTTTGDFIAQRGTFEDLTTLSRTGDAKLSHDGFKFIASGSFGLSTANMAYKKYKLRYGIIKVNGKLSADVEDAAITATASVDYNQKPCRVQLSDLRVSNVGKVKVKLTGLGPLNKLLSKLVSWITKKWTSEIVSLVEDKLRIIVAEHLNNFDCERFRL